MPCPNNASVQRKRIFGSGFIKRQFRILVMAAAVLCIDQILKKVSLSVAFNSHALINYETYLGNDLTAHVLFCLGVFLALSFLSAYKSSVRDFRMDWGTALLASGIFSNEIDRIFTGGVIDYIKIPAGGLEIYTNIADAASVAGAVLLSFAVSREIYVLIKGERGKP